MSYVNDFRALISDYRLNAMAPKGTPVFVTFSFLANTEVPSLTDYQPYANDGYFAFSVTQQANFRTAIAEYSMVSGIRFIEVDDPDDATLLVMNTDGSPWAGWANLGSGTRNGTSQGYLVIDGAGGYASGSYGYETILHELGHVAGLKHPFEGDPQLLPRLDNETNTLMSYASNGQNDTALAHLDIDALHHLYGGSGAVKPGWSWHFEDATHRFFLTGSMKADRLIGTDTDSVILARAGDDRIFGRDEDDIARGQHGDDRFMLGHGDNEAYGGKGKDVFVDYWGNDLFAGGGGSDTVSFVLSPVGVFVDLGLTGVQVNLGRDTFISIENITGSAQGDQIIGSDDANVLKGRAGNDALLGDAGNDRLIGQRGDDELDGGVGNDVLTGGRGDDVLTGGAGADQFVFRPGTGVKAVTDFVDGEDFLAFPGFGFANRAEARAQFHEIGTSSDDTVGFDDRGTTIVIHGVDLADIRAADILI